jgi:ankyrin repeat protein
MAGEAALAALFLEHGARVDAQDLQGSSALFIAAELERRSLVRLLLEHGANVNLPGRNGISPLAAAAYTGNIEIIELLLEKGADAGAIDATGKSALAYAAGRGFTSIVRSLLQRKVDVNARLGNDLTALMWAAGHSEEAGSADVVETIAVLLDAGARVNDKDNRGRTALMIAAELGHTQAIEVLVRRGADRALTDKAGNTARDLASSDSLRNMLAAK